MEDLLKLRNVKGKLDTMFTIIVYNYKKENFLAYLDKQLDSINNKMKDAFKKKLINDRIYDFKLNVESSAPDMINFIYLVGDDLHKYELSKKEIKILTEYKIRTLYYEYDEKFQIDYIDKLFNDFTFYKVAELDKKCLTFYDMNSTKIKKINSESVNNQNELAEMSSNYDLVHGNSTLLKNFTCNKIFFNKRLSPDEVIDEIGKMIIKNDHNKLEDLFDNMTNPKYDNKIFLGGMETKKYTEMSLVKTLFIHESIYKRFLKHFSEYINFEIIEIKKLEPGDISTKLLNDYDKCIGELYYAAN